VAESDPEPSAVVKLAVLSYVATLALVVLLTTWTWVLVPASSVVGL